MREKSRLVRIWVGVGVLAIGICVAILARPNDVIGSLRQLASKEEVFHQPWIAFGGPRPTPKRSSTIRTLHFRVPVAQVEARLPPPTPNPWRIYKYYVLRDGTTIEMSDPKYVRAEETCVLIVDQEDLPWYTRALSSFRSRLGF